MSDTKVCNQCWRDRPTAEFLKKGRELQDCGDCRAGASEAEQQRRAGVPRRRRGLEDGPSDRVLFIERSMNRKLGPIPAAITSAGSCPRSCAFWGRGCYAEHGLLGAHWKRAAAALSWEAFVERVRKLRPELWRYAVAGDLPGRGENIDLDKAWQLVCANYEARARGFTFTHKPLGDPVERALVRTINRAGLGFTINLSANGPEHADELADLAVGPVATVVPVDWKEKRTPAGRRIVLCPSETHGLTCDRCGLCAVAHRKAIIGFRAHGQAKAIVSDIVRRQSRIEVAA